jgi:hypothetical protein
MAPTKCLDVGKCKVLHGVMGWLTQGRDQILADQNGHVVFMEAEQLSSFGGFQPCGWMSAE